MADVNKINEFFDMFKQDEEIEVTYNVGDFSMSFNVKTYLPLDEMIDTVNHIASLCFDDGGNYNACVKDAVLKIYTLMKLTDIQPYFNEDGGIDMDKTYRLCEYINLKDNVDNDDFQNLIDKIEDFVEDQIIFMQQVNVSGNIRTINRCVEEIEGYSNSLKELADQRMEDMKALLNDDSFKQNQEFLSRMSEMSNEELIGAIIENNKETVEK